MDSCCSVYFEGELFSRCSREKAETGRRMSRRTFRAWSPGLGVDFNGPRASHVLGSRKSISQDMTELLTWNRTDQVMTQAMKRKA